MKIPKKHPRNADGIPDDVLLPLAPIQPPVLAPPPSPPSFTYTLPPARPRPSRARRAARVVTQKAGQLAQAIKPEAATITKEHLLGVGANAAGGIATALAANELVDNIGVMPMALGATIVGGLGSAFLKGNWQKAAQGMLGAGVGHLGTAYLTERALKRAAAAQKQVAATRPANQNAPAAAAAGKRNAYLGGDDDDTMLRALERTERRVNAYFADDDPRNAYGDSGIDGDAFDVDGYAV